jgi:hypothetical protein
MLFLKSIHFSNSVFSVDENKVLQLMSVGASLERFGEQDLVFSRKLCIHCFKNEWTLAGFYYVKKQNFLWEILKFQFEDKISKPFMHDWKFCFCDILKPQNQKKSIYWVNELSNLTLPLDFSIDWNFPTGMSLSWLSCSFIRSFSNASLPCRQFDRWDLDHSRGKQRTEQRVLVLTLKFLALKKTVFSPVKKTSQFFYLYSMQLFSADATIFSKKFQIYFLPMKT